MSSRGTFRSKEVTGIRRSRFVVSMLLALALLIIINLSAAAQPGQPTLVSPENNENMNDNTPLMDWGDVTGADNYHIQIDSDSDYSSPNVDNDNVGSVSQYTVPDENALPDGAYYWHVRAENADGLGSWSENWIFRVDTLAPAAPDLISPENNENVNDNTPNLRWATVEENSKPVLYYVAVSDNSEFPYENDNSGWIEDNNYQLTTELTDGNWYWHVWAKDNAGNVGDNSENWIFRVDKLMPELLSPADEVNTKDNTPTLSWENKVVADNWEIWIDNKTDWSTAIVDNTTSNTYTPTQLADNVYYWRVRGYRGADEGIFSSVRSFRVDTVAPPAPSLTSPENNEDMNDNTPNLTWENLDPIENTTPVRYYVAVSDNSEFPYENDNSGCWILGDNYQLTTELAEGVWYLRVQAKDNAGNVGDNSQRSFRVDVTAPTISGLTELNVSQNSITIEWTTDEPADSVVEYGTTTTYELPPQSDNSLVTNHSITLTNLLAGTTYNYRVKSGDATKNTEVSGDEEFTTSPLMLAPLSPYIVFLAGVATSLAAVGAFLKIKSTMKPKEKIPKKVELPPALPKEDVRKILGMLTAHERKIVEELIKKDDLTQKALCDKTGIPKATMSRILQRLENKGIISRMGYGVSKRVSLTKWARGWRSK